MAPFPRGMRAGRAEIDFHLLPGLDDGPRDLDEAILLAALACMEGTVTIVATPHVSAASATDPSSLPDRVREVRDALAAEGIEIEILLGAELSHHMVGRLDQAELELLAQGPTGGRWLLVEAPFAGVDHGFEAAMQELRERGFAAVLAHPERCRGALDDDCAALAGQVEQGSVLEVSARSLEGRHGDRARETALELIRRFPCVVSSDAHDRLRPPALSAGLCAAIRQGVRHDMAHRMVDAAPRALLRDGFTVPLARAA